MSIDSFGEVDSQCWADPDGERLVIHDHLLASRGEVPQVRGLATLPLYIRVQEDGHHCQGERMGIIVRVRGWAKHKVELHKSVKEAPIRKSLHTGTN